MGTEVLHKKKMIAPKLRFKEFGNKWNNKKLGDVLEITSASRVLKDEWTEKGVPFFRSSDVVASFKGTENTKAYISFELYTSLANKTGRVKKDDLLITGGGSIGIPFLIKDDQPLYFKDADLLWIKNNNEISGYFLYFFFLTKSFKNYINITSHVGTIAHYTVIQAKNTPFQFPSLPEQQKIASFLSAVDEKIQQLTRKKELLEQYKKGAMQLLFSGKLRFKDDNGKDYPKWEDISIGEIFKFKQGVQAAIEEQVFEQQNNFVRFIRIVDLTKSDEPIRFIKDPGQEHHIKDQDLFMVRYGNPGVVGFGYNGVIANNLFRILPVDKRSNTKFFKYWFEYIKKDLDALASSSTMPALNFGSLNTLKLKLPIIEEQKKIANYLSNIDNKIRIVNKQITQTQTIKKGLLQQMFV